MGPHGWTDRRTDGHTNTITRFTTGIGLVVNNYLSDSWVVAGKIGVCLDNIQVYKVIHLNVLLMVNKKNMFMP